MHAQGSAPDRELSHIQTTDIRAVIGNNRRKNRTRAGRSWEMCSFAIRKPPDRVRVPLLIKTVGMEIHIACNG